MDRFPLWRGLTEQEVPVAGKAGLMCVGRTAQPPCHIHAKTETVVDRATDAEGARLLNRKSVLSWARGSTRRSAAEPGEVELGSGGLLKGDPHAGEPFEFGDELALAADRGEPVVPVGAEVGEAGFGVR
jgi:hypothetical protein